MRIARYCTSVLISGRTIPVDVLLRPLRPSLVHACDRARIRVPSPKEAAKGTLNGEPRMLRINLLFHVFLCYSINCIAPWQLKPVGAKMKNEEERGVLDLCAFFARVCVYVCVRERARACYCMYSQACIQRREASCCFFFSLNTCKRIPWHIITSPNNIDLVCLPMCVGHA